MYEYPRVGVPRNAPRPLLPRLVKRTSFESNGCWTFLADKKRSHPKLGYKGKCEFVHRVGWQIHCGPIPEGAQVLHRCVGNGRCWNPMHLYLGNPQKNVIDRRVQGREGYRKGEINGRSKLTSDDIPIIRNSKATARHLGIVFGVHESSIEKVRSRHSWSHI